MRRFFILSVMFLSGCSMTAGSFNPSTHFTYPNSNVVPMGYVHVTSEEDSFFSFPTLTKEKILKLLDDALVQKPGADMITDYSIDTTYKTFFLIYNKQTLNLEGTAVKMVVGKKELVDKSKYQ